MLVGLSVSNFAIIDQLRLRFDKGLTIITGETGAGKSILLGALKLILGERADLKQINNPDKKCIIEADLDISKLNIQSFFESNELDYEPTTIVRRELLPGGKSRAFINDTPVNLSVLKEFGEQLIDIHSQFNTSELFNQNYQLQILDAYVGQLDAVKAYRTLFAKRSGINAELKGLEEELKDKSKESDYKQFLLKELEEANLNAEEPSTLEKEQSELQNVEEIQQVLGEVHDGLETPEYGLLARMHELTLALSKISDYGEDFEKLRERMESVRIELDDLRVEAVHKVNSLEPNPERLLEINERLDLIHNLLNKHHTESIEELLEIRDSLQNDESDFIQLEEKINRLKSDLDKINKELETKAKQLSQNRKKVVPNVEKEILESLHRLGMEDAQLNITLSPTAEPGRYGSDDIKFLFSANKGSSLKEVEKAASGGEQSRLMLAVKKSLSGRLELPTLILDEIDTGVSGRIANEVGELMKEMSKELQVISITHLPQVAAKADRHLKVRKLTADKKTYTEVVELEKADRITEIAGLISGSDITETAIKQAEELIGN